LRKIRELYRNAPVAILDHLANLEEVIALCQCTALEDESGLAATKNSRTYWYVLENLIEVSTPRRLPLQLYLCKSPYWEHYDRNVTEIMLLLDKILYAKQPVQQQQKQRTRSVSAGSSDSQVEFEFGDVEKFQRKFVPFSKVILDRQWASGWRSKAYYL